MAVRTKVLIAGIAGASLGTEIMKSLHLADKYDIYGCDISHLAYGHYCSKFKETFLVNPASYIDNIIDICSREAISYVIPGGESPMVILNQNVSILEKYNIKLMGNSVHVVSDFSDKLQTFHILSSLGFTVPFTKYIDTVDKLNEVSNSHYPLIVKPATDSGGSSFVFFAENKKQAAAYITYLLENHKKPIVQQYIDVEQGEFTVGVLHLPNGELVGSIAIKRSFNNKLSISQKLNNGLISSGSTQGYVGEFTEIRKTAEQIATAVQSKGPLNIQGRVKDGQFIPFEINPRFSASTYLRAMAGFNEIDMFIDYCQTGIVPQPSLTKYGYYLRSFTETFVSEEGLISD